MDYRICGCGLPIYTVGVLHINSERCEQDAKVLGRERTAWELEKYGVTNLREIAHGQFLRGIARIHDVDFGSHLSSGWGCVEVNAAPSSFIRCKCGDGHACRERKRSLDVANHVWQQETGMKQRQRTQNEIVKGRLSRKLVVRPKCLPEPSTLSLQLKCNGDTLE